MIAKFQHGASRSKKTDEQNQRGNDHEIVKNENGEKVSSSTC